MTRASRTSLAAAAAALTLALPAGAANAADKGPIPKDLPKATQAMMNDLKLPASVLAGLDDELKVPDDWIAKAKAGKKLVILSTWDLKQFRQMTAPFHERYPYIEVNYSRASYNQRVVRTLIAWKEGGHLADIITGFGGGYFLLRKAGALADLRDVPNWDNVPDGMKDPNGKWVGQRLRYWCMSYNTNLVKKSELPKTWEDLVTNDFWHGHKIGIGNRPQLWLLMLWGAKGPDWTKQYMHDLVDKVQPQLRKEGMNALIALTIAGEFRAAIPSAAYRTKQYAEKGAPISWHCPEPVPLAVSELGIMKGTPNMAAAKVWTNWFLSREGQIAQFATNNAPPVHKALQTREFLAYPDEIIGKKVAFRGPELEQETKTVFAAWDPIWKKNVSHAKVELVTLHGTLDSVSRGGRGIMLKADGNPRKVTISGHRTKVEIGGKPAKRNKLKPGMTCDVTLPQSGVEAKSVSCNGA